MKNSLLKKITIFNFMFVLSISSANAQFVQPFDTIYTPPGYSGGPLHALLWLPKHTNGTGVVLAHGATLNDTSMHVWGDSLAGHGYVVLSIDYYDFFDPVPTLYPNPVREFKFAIEFLRRNAFKFGLYTGRIAAFGMSEGAMHWAEAIIWDNDDAFFGTDPVISDHADAAVFQYGWYDNFKYLKSWFNNDSSTALRTMQSGYFSQHPRYRHTKGNPLQNIGNITTPVLLFHGTYDQLLQVEQSEEFRDSLLAHNKKVTLIEFPDDHLYDFFWDTVVGWWDFYRFSSLGLVSKDSTLAFLQRTLHPGENNCALPGTYWRKNDFAWNEYVLPMKLGIKYSYNKEQLMSLLSTPTGNDASRKLAQQLIAAKLNLANGSEASIIRSTIIEADNLIGERSIPVIPKITPNTFEGKKMMSLTAELRAFNNGILNRGCNGHAVFSQNDDINSSAISYNTISVAPNPFSNTTTISYSIPHPDKVSIQIYDMTGRLVKILADGQMRPGTHQLTWNANDEKGTAVATGMYFLKMQAGSYTVTKRIVVEK